MDLLMLSFLPKNVTVLNSRKENNAFMTFMVGRSAVLMEFPAPLKVIVVILVIAAFRAIRFAEDPPVADLLAKRKALFGMG